MGEYNMKTMLVTGATNGTGYAIAKRFAQAGYGVVITSREAERAEEAAARLAAETGVWTKGAALAPVDEAQILALFDALEDEGQPIDTVVLNAANLAINQDALTVDIEEFSWVFQTNIIWNFMLARKAALQMKENGGGAIVFINSNTAYRAIPERVAYSASKSGVLGMSRALALDWGKYGIRSNCVLPGMIKTSRWEKNYNNCKNVPSNYTPIGDIADFDDIANAAYFFGSEQAKNITGAELVVDGGNMIQLYPILPEESL
jgi:NAD(P)-dependent dehydrogenase (short-subunit alcohol dehydrogenase family)